MDTTRYPRYRTIGNRCASTFDPEVSVCLNLEERNTLSFVGTLAIWKFGRKSKKSMAVIIQN